MGAVASFESGPQGLVPLGRHESLAASSATLPRGAYTTFRSYGGNGVVRLAQHLRRLEESAALEGTPGRIDAAAARSSIGWALRETGHTESRVRLTFAPPRLFVAVEPFTPLEPARYEQGVACVTLDMHRDNPQAKDTQFIATARAAYARLPPGVEEGLLVADDGTLLEGLSSNFFAVSNGALRTEQERVLAGVTRSLALEAAAPIVAIERVGVRRDELPLVEEAFITSVSRELLPVVRIDERPVGSGRVGPVTRGLLQAFAALVAREREEL
jgi:branched-chain amino acid aminotransferase